jgi:hypothetical protein
MGMGKLGKPGSRVNGAENTRAPPLVTMLEGCLNEVEVDGEGIKMAKGSRWRGDQDGEGASDG